MGIIEIHFKPPSSSVFLISDPVRNDHDDDDDRACCPFPLGGKTHQSKGFTQTNDDDNCAADGGQPRRPSPGKLGGCVDQKGEGKMEIRVILFCFLFFISFGERKKRTGLNFRFDALFGFFGRIEL